MVSILTKNLQYNSLWNAIIDDFYARKMCKVSQMKKKVLLSSFLKEILLCVVTIKKIRII